MHDRRIEWQLAIGNITSLITQLNQIEGKFKDISKAGLGNSATDALGKSVGNAADKYTSLTSEITKARLETEKMYRAWNQAAPGVSKDQLFANFQQSRNKVKSLTNDFTSFNNLMNTTEKQMFSLGNSASYMGQKFKTHLSWTGAGLALGAVMGAPALLVNQLAQIEQGMAGMNQVIDHSRYGQEELNKETLKFIDIAAVYGEKVDNIIEAATLWGRMYKDISVVNALVGQSAQLAVADNFSLVDANKALEAAMFQYGMTAKNSAEALAYSGKIIDVWTKLAHNGGASAQDLSQAVERAGSVAKLTGVDFEFLNSMIATAVRSTGRSGAEVGNMIKSVLGSIHSNKAIEEIGALGVAVTKVGKSGQTEFRKAQDVLLDISIAAQGTEKNLEDLFKQTAGGKFQWSKAAAMLGDYQEFIRTWGEAVNSTGFTAEQVGMQLNTISRGMKTLTADLQGLVVNGGNAGLAQYIKEQIAGLDNFVVGLRQIPKETIEATMQIGKFAVGIYALVRAWELYKAATEAADIATMAIARKNIIILAMVGISYAIYNVVQSYGELETASRRALQQSQDALAVKNQEVNMYEEQAKFIDALVSAHSKLENQVQSGTLSDEKAQLAKRNLSATEEELTKVIGSEAVKRIEASGWSEEAIESEKKIFLDSIETKKQELKTMIQTQLESTRAEIQSMENKINAYYEDARHFGESIQAKLKALSVWQAAQLTYSEWHTAFYEKQAQMAQEEYDRAENDEQRAYALDSLGRANNNAQYWRDRGATVVQKPIKDLQNQIGDLKKTQVELMKGVVDYTPTGAGGSVIDESGGKTPKTTGNQSGATTSERARIQLEKMQLQYEVNTLLSQAKVKTDDYNTSLEVLNDSEKLRGTTVESVMAKLALYKSRQADLITQTQAMQKQADIYNKSAEDTIAGNKELTDTIINLTTKEGERESIQDRVAFARQKWNTLDKETKQQLLQEAQALLGESSLAYRQFEAALRLGEKAKELTNDAKNVGSDAITLAYGDRLNLDAMAKRQLDLNSNQESYALAKNYNRYDNNNEIRENNIRHNKLLADREVYAGQLLKIENDLEAAKEKLAIEYAKDKNSLDTITLQTQVQGLEDSKNKQLSIIALTNQKIIELENTKYEKIRSGMASIVDDIIVQGNSLKSIWNNLWNQLASDAIKALFRVQNTTPGLLSQLLGIFGGGGGSLTGTSSLSASRQSIANNLLPTSFGHATGGIFDQQHLAMFAEGNKKEAIIPLEENRQRALGIWSEVGKQLGAFKGTEVVPQMSPATVEAVNKASIAQAEVRQNKAHIQELEKQTILLQSVVQVLASGNNGSGQVAVIQTQVDAQTVLQVLQQNPDALQQILNNNSSLGYR